MPATSVMNVAIATVAEDVGTDVTGIQTAITLYTLVMATLHVPDEVDVKLEIELEDDERELEIELEW